MIQQLLGHESLATTEIYTHVSPERQQEAVKLLVYCRVDIDAGQPGR